VRALLSVATREGISVFARGLQALDVELFATDRTLEHLAQDGVEARPVTELTGVTNQPDGQDKTFHHAIYAGILARRDKPDQLEDLKRQGIEPIDIVVVNVEPFGAEIGRALVGLDKAIEMIDVGGAALLGAAARNPAGVAAVSSADH
jgi:phosphoribosylaminoimidazolecarboxamide formyltransferase/IMP cyclohydrolase